MNIPTNVTSIELYEAIAQFGPLYAAQLGYFNALDIEGADGSASKQKALVNVVAPNPTTNNLPPTYGYGDLDLTPYNLTEIPVLTGVVIDPLNGVKSYAVDFQEVTTTHAKVHCVYGVTADGFDRSTLPSFSQTVRVKIN